MRDDRELLRDILEALENQERVLKSPFSKGGFRGIIKDLFVIPPDPPLKKGGNFHPAVHFISGSRYHIRDTSPAAILQKLGGP